MKRVNENKQILERLKTANRPVVIYGALHSDEAVIQACRAMGIEVACICDDSLRKANNVWCGLPVYTFEDTLRRFGNCVFLLNISYLKNVAEKIEKAGCEWHSCKVIVESEAFEGLEGLEELEYDKSEIKRACYCHDNYLLPGKLYLSNIDVVVTERCSLRCRDCSNLMQFYERPQDYGTEEVVANVKRLLDIVDGIYELRFIGGEPFMNRALDRIMEPFIEDSRVERLLIYTNATILPRKEQWRVFQNHKVIFMITNYGADKSRNYEALLQELKERGATYHVLRMDHWNPCDTFELHDRSEEQLREVFADCCVKNYVTLIGEKLFRCPYSAHAMNLQAVPHVREDFFDTASEGPREDRRKALRRYLFEIDKLETCRYCRSRAFDSELIPVAVQCAEPRPYKKYANP